MFQSVSTLIYLNANSNPINNLFMQCRQFAMSNGMDRTQAFVDGQLTVVASRKFYVFLVRSLKTDGILHRLLLEPATSKKLNLKDQL